MKIISSASTVELSPAKSKLLVEAAIIQLQDLQRKKAECSGLLIKGAQTNVECGSNPVMVPGLDAWSGGNVKRQRLDKEGLQWYAGGEITERQCDFYVSIDEDIGSSAAAKPQFGPQNGTAQSHELVRECEEFWKQKMEDAGARLKAGTLAVNQGAQRRSASASASDRAKSGPNWNSVSQVQSARRYVSAGRVCRDSVWSFGRERNPPTFSLVSPQKGRMDLPLSKRENRKVCVWRRRVSESALVHADTGPAVDTACYNSGVLGHNAKSCKREPHVELGGIPVAGVHIGMMRGYGLHVSDDEDADELYYNASSENDSEYDEVAFNDECKRAMTHPAVSRNLVIKFPPMVPVRPTIPYELAAEGKLDVWYRKSVKRLSGHALHGVCVCMGCELSRANFLWVSQQGQRKESTGTLLAHVKKEALLAKECRRLVKSDDVLDIQYLQDFKHSVHETCGEMQMARIACELASASYCWLSKQQKGVVGAHSVSTLLACVKLQTSMIHQTARDSDEQVKERASARESITAHSSHSTGSQAQSGVCTHSKSLQSSSSPQFCRVQPHIGMLSASYISLSRPAHTTQTLTSSVASDPRVRVAIATTHMEDLLDRGPSYSPTAPNSLNDLNAVWPSGAQAGPDDKKLVHGVMVRRMEKAEKSRAARMKLKIGMLEKRELLEAGVNKWWTRIAKNYGVDMEHYVFKDHCRSFLMRADDFIIQFCLTKFQIEGGSKSFTNLRNHALHEVKKVFRIWRDVIVKRHPGWGSPGSVPEFDACVRMMKARVVALKKGARPDQLVGNTLFEEKELNAIDIGVSVSEEKNASVPGVGVCIGEEECSALSRDTQSLGVQRLTRTMKKLALHQKRAPGRRRSHTIFCVDSGANMHVCKHAAMARGSLISYPMRLGEAGSGHHFLSEGVGSIPVSFGGKASSLFSNVVFAEQISSNILSIVQTSKQGGMNAWFTDDKVEFFLKDGPREHPVLTGWRDASTDLYFVDMADYMPFGDGIAPLPPAGDYGSRTSPLMLNPVTNLRSFANGEAWFNSHDPGVNQMRREPVNEAKGSESMDVDPSEDEEASDYISESDCEPGSSDDEAEYTGSDSPTYSPEPSDEDEPPPSSIVPAGPRIMMVRSGGRRPSAQTNSVRTPSAISGVRSANSRGGKFRPEGMYAQILAEEEAQEAENNAWQDSRQRALDSPRRALWSPESGTDGSQQGMSAPIRYQASQSSEFSSSSSSGSTASVGVVSEAPQAPGWPPIQVENVVFEHHIQFPGKRFITVDNITYEAIQVPRPHGGVSLSVPALSWESPQAMGAQLQGPSAQVGDSVGQVTAAVANYASTAVSSQVVSQKQQVTDTNQSVGHGNSASTGQAASGSPIQQVQGPEAQESFVGLQGTISSVSPALEVDDQASRAQTSGQSSLKSTTCTSGDQNSASMIAKEPSTCSCGAPIASKSIVEVHSSSPVQYSLVGAAIGQNHNLSGCEIVKFQDLAKSQAQASSCDFSAELEWWLAQPGCPTASESQPQTLTSICSDQSSYLGESVAASNGCETRGVFLQGCSSEMVTSRGLAPQDATPIANVEHREATTTLMAQIEGCVIPGFGQPSSSLSAETLQIPQGHTSLITSQSAQYPRQLVQQECLLSQSLERFQVIQAKNILETGPIEHRSQFHKSKSPQQNSQARFSSKIISSAQVSIKAVRRCLNLVWKAMEWQARVKQVCWLLLWAYALGSAMAIYSDEVAEITVQGSMAVWGFCASVFEFITQNRVLVEPIQMWQCQRMLVNRSEEWPVMSVAQLMDAVELVLNGCAAQATAEVIHEVCGGQSAQGAESMGEVSEVAAVSDSVRCVRVCKRPAKVKKPQPVIMFRCNMMVAERLEDVSSYSTPPRVRAHSRKSQQVLEPFFTPTRAFSFENRHLLDSFSPFDMHPYLRERESGDESEITVGLDMDSSEEAGVGLPTHLVRKQLMFQDGSPSLGSPGAPFLPFSPLQSFDIAFRKATEGTTYVQSEFDVAEQQTASMCSMLRTGQSGSEVSDIEVEAKGPANAQAFDMGWIQESNNKMTASELKYNQAQQPGGVAQIGSDVKYGPYLPYEPWLGMDFGKWSGPPLVRELDASMVAALMKGDVTVLFITAEEWLVFGAQGYIIVVIRQSRDAHTKERVKVPAGMGRKLNHTLNGKFVGLGVAWSPESVGYTPDAAAFLRYNKAWIESYTRVPKPQRGSIATCGFAWLLQFKEALMPKSVYLGSKAFIPISVVDQQRVMVEVGAEILKKPGVRLDGTLAVDNKGQAPSTETEAFKSVGFESAEMLKRGVVADREQRFPFSEEWVPGVCYNAVKWSMQVRSPTEQEHLKHPEALGTYMKAHEVGRLLKRNRAAQDDYNKYITSKTYISDAVLTADNTVPVYHPRSWRDSISYTGSRSRPVVKQVSFESGECAILDEMERRRNESFSNEWKEMERVFAETMQTEALVQFQINSIRVTPLQARGRKKAVLVQSEQKDSDTESDSESGSGVVCGSQVSRVLSQRDRETAYALGGMQIAPPITPVAEAETVPESRVISVAFPNLQWAPEPDKIFRASYLRRYTPQSGVRELTKLFDVHEWQVPKHIAYTRGLDEGAERHEEEDLLFTTKDNRHLHLPFFCQGACVGWRAKNYTRQIVPVPLSRLGEVREFIGEKRNWCMCAQHVADVTRFIARGAMTAVRKFSMRGVKFTLETYNGRPRVAPLYFPDGLLHGVWYSASALVVMERPPPFPFGDDDEEEGSPLKRKGPEARPEEKKRRPVVQVIAPVGTSQAAESMLSIAGRTVREAKAFEDVSVSSFSPSSVQDSLRSVVPAETWDAIVALSTAAVSSGQKEAQVSASDQVERLPSVCAPVCVGSDTTSSVQSVFTRASGREVTFTAHTNMGGTLDTYLRARDDTTGVFTGYGGCYSSSSSSSRSSVSGPPPCMNTALYSSSNQSAYPTSSSSVYSVSGMYPACSSSGNRYSTSSWNVFSPSLSSADNSHSQESKGEVFHQSAQFDAPNYRPFGYFEGSNSPPLTSTETGSQEYDSSFSQSLGNIGQPVFTDHANTDYIIAQALQEDEFQADDLSLTNNNDVDNSSDSGDEGDTDGGVEDVKANPCESKARDAGIESSSTHPPANADMLQSAGNVDISACATEQANADTLQTGAETMQRPIKKARLDFKAIELSMLTSMDNVKTMMQDADALQTARKRIAELEFLLNEQLVKKTKHD